MRQEKKVAATSLQMRSALSDGVLQYSIPYINPSNGDYVVLVECPDFPEFDSTQSSEWQAEWERKFKEEHYYEIFWNVGGDDGKLRTKKSIRQVTYLEGTHTFLAIGHGKILQIDPMTAEYETLRQVEEEYIDPFLSAFSFDGKVGLATIKSETGEASFVCINTQTMEISTAENFPTFDRLDQFFIFPTDDSVVLFNDDLGWEFTSTGAEDVLSASRHPDLRHHHPLNEYDFPVGVLGTLPIYGSSAGGYIRWGIYFGHGIESDLVVSTETGYLATVPDIRDESKDYEVVRFDRRFEARETIHRLDHRLRDTFTGEGRISNGIWYATTDGVVHFVTDDRQWDIRLW